MNYLKRPYKKGQPISSKYKGIGWDKIAKRWVAQIQINKKHYYIGKFKSELHAAMARDIWAKELHGEFATLNFKGV